MHRIARGTLAALLMAGVVPAMADVTASAQLSNFGLQLIDLDPNDGIAPSIDLTRFDSHAFAYGGTGAVAVDGTSVFGAVAADSPGADTSATAAIAGDLLAGGVARADASTLASYAQAFINAGTFGMSPTFTLSPHTELVFTGTADVAASIGAGPGQSEADVELGLSGPAPDFLFDHDARSAIALASGAPSASSHGDLSVSFSNLSDVAVDGTFYVYVMAVSSNVPPVPEPANGALMLGALAGLAMALRRRAD